MKTLVRFAPYLALLLFGAYVSFASQHIPSFQILFLDSKEGVLLALTLLAAVVYGLNVCARKTAISPVIWAIILGMSLQVPLSVLTDDRSVLTVVTELLAAFALFAAGIEIPIKNFKRYFGPIAALAVAGTVLTVLTFAYAISGLTQLFDISIPALSLIVLCAILASTDPSAVLAHVQALHFRKPFLRDIIASEGALNDVVGAVLTRFFLVVALGAASAGVHTIGQGVAFLASRDAVNTIILETIWGILVGLLGAWLLQTWGASVREVHWSDIGLFIAVPVFCFALGSLIGSGYVAAFVAGLLFESRTDTHTVRAFFEQFISRTIQPLIFILLGALVPLVEANGGELGVTIFSTMGIGVAAALVFMFVIRPLVVFITLLPWMQQPGSAFSVRELVFLSFVRETGTVPAILLLIAVLSGLVAGPLVYCIGVWVILITHAVEPPLTPLLAQRLGIAA